MNWHVRPATEAQRPFVIGLVNNTSDRALRMTESQFLRLLRQASPGTDLQFRFFTCPEIRRAGGTRGYSDELYEDIGQMGEAHLDALVVTGMEPQAARLQDEPIWGSLTRIVDWAQDRCTPVLWSCLAAHAAVLYMDGIARLRLPEKLSGLFECHCVLADHPLMTGLPACWLNPHSRYHDLPEAHLAAKGYQLLSTSKRAGVDIFMKRVGAPFVFFQGHPEYDADSILLEYRRDIRRYWAGETQECPMTPENYLDANTAARLEEIREQESEGRRDPAGLDKVLRLLNHESGHGSWQVSASRLYSNWLAQLTPDRPDAPLLEPLSRHVEALIP